MGFIEDLKQDPEVKEAYMSFEDFVESERREARREAEAERDALKGERDAAVNELGEARRKIAELEERIRNSSL